MGISQSLKSKSKFVLVMIFALILTLIPLASAFEDAGRNYSTTPSDYFLWDNFNRADGSLGSANTGQVWSSTAGNLNISSNTLNDQGNGVNNAACINISDNPLGANLTLELWFNLSQNTAADMFAVTGYNSNDCSGSKATEYLYLGGAWKNGVGTALGGNNTVALNTQYIMKSDIDENANTFDMRIYTVRESGGVIQEDLEASTAAVSFLNAQSNLRSLSFFTLAPANNVRIQYDEIAYYQTFNRPAPAAPSDPVLTVLSPVANTLTAQDPIPLNYTLVLDAGATLANITIFVNGTLNKTLETEVNTTLELIEGTYDITVTALDSNGNTDTEVINSVIIDRTNPFDDLTTIIPPGTDIFEDVNYTINAQNTNLFGHNVTCRANNGTGAILFSQEDLNISQPTHAITIPIDISAYGIGTFQCISNESDDHTHNQIHEYIVTQSIATRTLGFDTGKAVITVTLVEGTGINNGGQRIDQTNSLTSLGALKRSDRYVFDYSFNAQGFASYEFVFDVLSDRIIYHRANSDYQGHLVIGNEHWLDFEGEATVTDVLEVAEKHYRITVVSTEPTLHFESIGGVNIGTSTTWFDIVAPTANTITCEVDSSFVDCTTVDFEDVLTQTRIDCDAATSSVMSVIENGTVLRNQITGTQSGSDWTSDIADLTIGVGNYTVNATCINELGSNSIEVNYTTTAPFVSPVFTSVLPLASVALLVGVIMVFFSIIRLFPMGKKGGNKK